MNILHDYERHRVRRYEFLGALAGAATYLGIAAGTTAPAVATGVGVGGGVAAAAIPTATLTGTALGSGLGTASALSLGATAGSGIAATGAIGTTGLGLGAGTAAAAGGAGTAAAAGSGAGLGISAGTAVQLASLGASAGAELYQANQQEKAIDAQAKVEARQTEAQQAAYADRVRQVLALNTAGGAARGVVGGGSLAALQQSNIEGAQADIGMAGADLSDRMQLFNAARKNARLGGYSRAGTSILSGLVI